MGTNLTGQLKIASDPAVPFVAACDQDLNGGSGLVRYDLDYADLLLSFWIPLGDVLAVPTSFSLAGLLVTEAFDDSTANATQLQNSDSGTLLGSAMNLTLPPRSVPTSGPGTVCAALNTDDQLFLGSFTGDGTTGKVTIWLNVLTA